MNKKVKYSSRKWISPNTNSSGYVMCYYDPECLNDQFQFFVRIADCSGSFVLVKNITQTKSMRQIISNIIDVLENKKSIYKFRNLGYQYRFRIRKWKKKYTDYHSLIYCYYLDICGKNLIKPRIADTNTTKPKFKNIVTIHASNDTYTLLDWDKKIKVIINELRRFIEFIDENLINENDK